MNDTAIIVGAGFSRVAKLPTTDEIGGQFVTFDENHVTPTHIQALISRRLREFWSHTFGYKGGPTPSFEDHFTALDLAANTGHNLGPRYSPRALRAIRRLSIHRVFDIIDRPAIDVPSLRDFLRTVADGERNVIISTNWDLVVENRLLADGRQFHYGIPMMFVDGHKMPQEGLPLLKLHGSSNWMYCDSCRSVFSGREHDGKAALQQGVFLEEQDFLHLGVTLDELQPFPSSHKRDCPCCDVPLSARVATFSYSKAFDFFQFHGVWEQALQRIRAAKTWMFVGYSLPHADFELRHMLKTAELGRRPGDAPKIKVVLKGKPDDPAGLRYRQFFGLEEDAIFLRGFESWWDSLYGGH